MRDRDIVTIIVLALIALWLWWKPKPKEVITGTVKFPEFEGGGITIDADGNIISSPLIPPQ
jgi:hypothetical protein